MTSPGRLSPPSRPRPSKPRSCRPSQQWLAICRRLQMLRPLNHDLQPHRPPNQQSRSLHLPIQHWRPPRCRHPRRRRSRPRHLVVARRRLGCAGGTAASQRQPRSRRRPRLSASSCEAASSAIRRARSFTDSSIGMAAAASTTLHIHRPIRSDPIRTIWCCERALRRAPSGGRALRFSAASYLTTCGRLPPASASPSNGSGGSPIARTLSLSLSLSLSLTVALNLDPERPTERASSSPKSSPRLHPGGNPTATATRSPTRRTARSAACQSTYSSPTSPSPPCSPCAPSSPASAYSASSTSSSSTCHSSGCVACRDRCRPLQRITADRCQCFRPD